jgi:hypothetical protein
MKLMTEFIDIKNISVLKEAVEGMPKTYKISGPFLQASIKNQNGRIYSEEICQAAINEYKNKITARRALGQLGHIRTPEIIFEKVSHKITSLEYKDKIGYGDAKILTEFPMGKIAMAAIDEDLALGVSTRGVGSADDDGNVQPGYGIAAIDIVYDPSAPLCMVEAIVEQKDWIIGPDGNYVEAPMEQLKRDIDKNFDSASAAEALNKFIRSISLKQSLRG